MRQVKSLAGVNSKVIWVDKFPILDTIAFHLTL